MTDPLKHFPDPDDIGQMEYRAIHDHIKEVLDDCPGEERFDLAIGMLYEFEEWAKDLREKLISSEKAS